MVPGVSVTSPNLKPLVKKEPDKLPVISTLFVVLLNVKLPDPDTVPASLNCIALGGPAGAAVADTPVNPEPFPTNDPVNEDAVTDVDMLALPVKDNRVPSNVKLASPFTSLALPVAVNKLLLVLLLIVTPLPGAYEADKALRMAAPEYVPFVNIAKEAFKYLGDSKFEMQTIQSDGRYNYTITNGVPAEAPLHNYLLAMYGNDPNLQKMYRVSAYLQRKQYGEEHAEEFGGTQEAERDYVSKVLKAQDETLRSYKEEVANRQREINAKKSVADKYIQNEGIDPNADQDFIKYYQSLNSDLQATTATDDYYSSALDDTLPSALESLDFDVLAERIDNMLGMSILDSDMAQIASAYATTTQKIEKEVDEIYLTQLKHQNSLSEIAARGSVQQSLEKTRQANRLEELYWESVLGVGKSSTTNKDGTPKINKTTTPGLEFLTDAEILQYKDNINKNYEIGWSVQGTNPYAEGNEYELSDEEIKRLEEEGYVFEETE